MPGHRTPKANPKDDGLSLNETIRERRMDDEISDSKSRIHAGRVACDHCHYRHSGCDRYPGLSGLHDPRPGFRRHDAGGFAHDAPEAGQSGCGVNVAALIGQRIVVLRRYKLADKDG